MAKTCLEYGIIVNNVSVLQHRPIHRDRKRIRNADVHGEHGSATVRAYNGGRSGGVLRRTKDSCKVFPTILSRLSYTKIVKIVAIRNVSWAKNSPKCICGRVRGAYNAPPDPLVGWWGAGVTPFPFLAPVCLWRPWTALDGTFGASTHCPGTNYEKSAPMIAYPTSIVMTLVKNYLFSLLTGIWAGAEEALVKHWCYSEGSEGRDGTFRWRHFITAGATDWLDYKVGQSVVSKCKQTTTPQRCLCWGRRMSILALWW